MNRKGAFQISLGMIVSLIFAVVILGAGLVLINNILNNPDIENTIDYTFSEQAKNMMLQNLETVGLAAPAVMQWEQGRTGAVALGIKNDEFAANTQKFTIDVSVKKSGTEINGYVTYPEEVTLGKGQKDAFNIIIQIPDNAPEGIYTATVTVYKGTSTNDIWYGEEYFAIEVV